MRVVADEILTAFVSVWPTTGVLAGVKLRAHAKDPGETADTYAVIKCRESRPANIESDGLAEQAFDVSLQVWSSRVPPPTKSIAQVLAGLYDGTTATPNAGLTLTAPAQVTLVVVQSSAIDRDPERRAGNDVLIASRNWQVITNTTGC
jgi:hypothetical protein